MISPATEERRALAYVCQYVFADDARNLGVDVLERLSRDHDLRVFTQRKDVGAGVYAFSVGTIRVEAVDFKRRLGRAVLLDKLLKRPLGMRKAFTDIIQLRRFLKRNRPDGVLVEGVWPWGGLFRLASLGLSGYGRNVIVTRHAVEDLAVPFDYPGRSQSRVIMALARRLVYRYFTVRANSPMTRQWLLDSGAPVGHVWVVPVGISEAFPYRPRRAARAALPTFCSLSRLAPIKGLDVLIRAFRVVHDRYPDARLDIYGLARHVPGIGDYGEYLRRCIDAAGLAQVVSLCGGVPAERVGEVLGRYDVHVASSHVETLNLVVAEAASRGVPSLVTRYCGIATWVEETGAGRLCDCTEDGLAAGMIAFIEMSETEYVALRNNTKALWKVFTPDAVAAEMGALIAEVVSPRRDEIVGS